MNACLQQLLLFGTIAWDNPQILNVTLALPHKKSEYWGRAANVTDPLEYKAGWSGFTLFAIQSDPASVKCSNYYYEKLKF